MPFKHTKESHIGIHDDPLDPNSLAVTRETFWVSRADTGDGDQAEWTCLRKPPHVHTLNCFTINFNKNGTPFDPPNPIVCTSPGHAVSAGIQATVFKGSTIYQYQIVVPGKNPLDPGGGVKG
jgi:hypothetical protein